MKISNLTSEKYPLSGAYFTVEKVGQEEIHTSDEVIVEFRVFLSTATSSALAAGLRFGQRVEILGEALFAEWGCLARCGEYRYKIKRVKGQNWGELFKTAAELADEEIKKLESALEARKNALIIAEEDLQS